MNPLERPIFVVCPPCSGESELAAALLAAPGSWHAGEGAEALLGAVAQAGGAEGPDGDRLNLERTLSRGASIRKRLLDRYASLDMTGRPGDAKPRLFDATPRNALRVPLLDALFDDPVFVYVNRRPAAAIADSLAVWRSGEAVTHPRLPDWDGPPWSLLLVPDWAELSGLEAPEIVVEQWARTASILLDDLGALPPDRWCVADHDALLDDPDEELQRLFRFLGIGWHSGCSEPFHAGRRERVPPPELEPLLERAGGVAERASEYVAPVTARRPRRDPGAEPEVTDDGLGLVLESLGSSLLVSTYHSNRLVALRCEGGVAKPHSRSFDRPMGMATHSGGFALGTRAEVLDLRDFPAVARNLEPRGRHDACFMPRNSHYTADIAIHDLAFAGDELWLVASRFNCLATLDATHSFVPRWRPPFVTAFVAEDRCHLNGIAIVDGKPRFATALGVADVSGGWRADKADGGVVVEVPSGEVVISGLSMPHSPRWHDGALWFAESGRGTLSRLHPASGAVEVVAELPGFTRGICFSGEIAFVGLSQIRETATFGGLAIGELERRECGVWAVDMRDGSVRGSLRFEDTVQEIFDVAVLPGVRYPDIAESGSPVADSSWFLPRPV